MNEQEILKQPYDIAWLENLPQNCSTAHPIFLLMKMKNCYHGQDTYLYCEKVRGNWAWSIRQGHNVKEGWVWIPSPKTKSDVLDLLRIFGDDSDPSPE